MKEGDIKTNTKQNPPSKVTTPPPKNRRNKQGLDSNDVLAWLGRWRDYLPKEAIEQLQKIVSVHPNSNNE